MGGSRRSYRRARCRASRSRRGGGVAEPAPSLRQAARRRRGRIEREASGLSPEVACGVRSPRTKICAAQHIATMPGINQTTAEKQWFVAIGGDRVCDQIGSFGFRAANRIATMSISMYNSSVGVFTQFLVSLSHLLDRASVHAQTRKLEPSILLNARLYPHTSTLTRHVGEALRHAVLSCSLLAGVDPPRFPDTEPDIPELKARVSTRIDFLRNLAAGEVHGALRSEVISPFLN